MATIIAHHDHCAIVENGPSGEHVAQALPMATASLWR